MEEIRRILQSGATVGSPARTFLGVSPPARCSDGIVHDAAWHRRNCRASQQLYPQVCACGCLASRACPAFSPWWCVQLLSSENMLFEPVAGVGSHR